MAEKAPQDDLEARRSARLLLAQIERFEARIKERDQRVWRKLVGDRLDYMLTCRAATEEYLSSADPKFRAGAFWLIAQHWRPLPEAEQVYRRSLLCDSEFNVRAAALACLTGLYLRTANREVSGMLAKIIKEDRNSLYLRREAYIGLLRVQGIEISPNIHFVLATCHDNLPQEINWGLIDSLIP